LRRSKSEQHNETNCLIFIYLIREKQQNENMYFDPALCGIARDHGPALCGIVRELSVEIFPADPALCGIA
jgi:hypothetical protein